MHRSQQIERRVNSQIRTVMARATTRHGMMPRTISFKGCPQTLEAFGPLLDFPEHRSADFCRSQYHQLLDAIACHQVADRPDRYEPRKRQRNPRKADMMASPRWELKRLMRRGVTNT